MPSRYSSSNSIASELQKRSDLHQDASKHTAVLQKLEKKLEVLQAKQKRANRLTACDLLLLADADALQQACRMGAPCVQVVRSSWDTGLSEQSQPALLRLAATAHEAAQGPIENMWHPSRGKGTRLSLLPAANSHRFLMHATALRFSTEQASATCAAAASAAAWNICCAPKNAWNIALGTTDVSPEDSMPSQTSQHSPQPVPAPSHHHTAHHCESGLCSNQQPPSSDTPFTEPQEHCSSSSPDLSAMMIFDDDIFDDDQPVQPSSIKTGKAAQIAAVLMATASTSAGVEGTSVAEAACAAVASEAQTPWPLFERDILEVYAEQESGRLSATLRAVGRALGATTAAARAHSSGQVRATASVPISLSHHITCCWLYFCGLSQIEVSTAKSNTPQYMIARTVH